MDDDEPLGEHEAGEWPFEGHFVVGGSGLYVSIDCLAGVFASRTASYDLTIGFPQVDTRPDPIPPELARRAGMPPIPRLELIPPEWTYGPRNEYERQEEVSIHPVWGTTFGVGAKKVYPESMRNVALVGRCRFKTTVTAADVEQFDAACEDFLRELDDWWERFTSWVSILTGQDFDALGGYPWGATRSRPLLTWTADENGQRDRVQDRWYFPPQREGFERTSLPLQQLRGCVAATGSQNPPPAEWLFIRDARALLNTGHMRRAVLDAGTAAEIAMSTLVDRYLDEATADATVKKAVTARYDSLSAMKDLLGWFWPDLLPPKAETDQLIAMRNTAIHGRGKQGRRWDEITPVEARTAIEIAAKIVEAAHPLAGLVDIGAT